MAPVSQLRDEYLFSFAKFTQWPAPAFGTEATLCLCIAGKDPFGEVLTALESRTVQNRQIRIRKSVQAATLRGCQILYIVDIDTHRVDELLRAAADLPVLTLSDAEAFSEHGGIVGLATSDKRIVFGVDIDAASQANVRLSSQILRLAVA